jgi:molybdopterin/thiamine biosynthesis adenylyltransferase/rhodanese-related sulfurtransferase/molybdopterin converting factor small subunit
MATVKVLLPTPLRRFAEGNNEVSVSAETVLLALESLVTLHPALRVQLFSSDGSLRKFVHVFVNNESFTRLSTQSPGKVLIEGDVVVLVPAIAGGSSNDNTAIATLSRDEVFRYSRHLLMPEIGIEGQRRLKSARILCVGAGGLGAPALLYLAAAGVGKIGIVEYDKVDLSNLHRQVIYTGADIGRSKVEIARKKLLELNSEIEIVPHYMRLSNLNAMEIISEYDIVLDCTDNFPTRYLINDACVLLKKPYIYGSIFRFEGQVSTLCTKDGPCYRCLFPEPPPPDFAPSCAEGGVLGVLPGVIGTIQATEVIKEILSLGSPLIGRVLLFDALQMRTHELLLTKDPNCAACGKSPTLTELIDYRKFCGLEDAELSSTGLPLISAEELKIEIDENIQFEILDVREPHEFEIVKIQNSRLIPLSQLHHRIHEIDSAARYVITCHKGKRSQEAYQQLRQAGLCRLQILDGGIDEWAAKIDVSLPRY